MRTQLPSTARMLALAGFALASILLLLGLYWTFGGTRPLAPRPYTVVVPLVDAGTLVSGQDVQISGVEVGRVARVVRAGDHAEAVIEIKSDFVPIRSGARAILRTKTLLGEAYIEIAPGRRDAAPITEGGTLAPSRVKKHVPLDEFLETFNPRVLADMRRTFRGWARAFRDRPQSLNNSLARQEPLSEGLTSVMQALDAQSSELRAMFASSGEIFRALGGNAGDLRAAVRNGNEVLAVTARRERELAAIVRTLPPFLREVRATSAVVDRQSGDFNRAMRDLLPVAAQLPPSLRATAAHMPALERLFRRLPPTLEAARRGFPAFRAVVRAMPAGFGGLYPALRELIPVAELFATYSLPAFVRPLATAAAALNGTQVGPFGKIVDRNNGAIFVSNETVQGWIKRLPSHRSNPYPEPTAFEELEKRGFMKSYDCRHERNRAYLPPLGTGVPPCLTQGPWTYGGKRAYYPQLTRDPP